MKKQTQLHALILIIMIIISGCKKDKPNSPNAPDSEVIIGNINLPNGSSTDANMLTVVGFQEEVLVINSSYEINELKEHNTLFVLDANDEVMMMGYLYPGQTDYTIDARSTTLALLMNMPFSFQISKTGKTNFVNKILKDGDFQNIVATTENLLRQGISPFDTTQTAYAIQLSQYLVDISAKKTEQMNGQPAQILRSGKDLIIQNTGKSYATGVGIYKDGSKVKSFVLDRANYIPSSDAQVLASLNNDNVSFDVVSESYTMQHDGLYEIKIRNGEAVLPIGAIESSNENKDAWIKNVTNFGIDIFSNIVPLDASCLHDVTNSFFGFVQNIFNANNAQNLTMADIYDIQKKWLNVTGSGISCLNKSLTWKRLNLVLKKYFGWTAWVNRIGSEDNILIGISQLASDEPAIDTCFMVSGNNVVECRACGGITSFTDPRDNQTYNVVQIGNQCWMAENLNYITANSWCFNDDVANCAVYGRLYAWQQALTVCPPGWHLPSDAEWTKLSDYLGGESVAGGKMKSTTGWILPNTDASNSSGFSALPGGDLINDNFTSLFSSLGNFGCFWSSTRSDFDSNYALYRAIHSNSGSLDELSDYKASGLSCRCLMD